MKNETNLYNIFLKFFQELYLNQEKSKFNIYFPHSHQTTVHLKFINYFSLIFNMKRLIHIWDLPKERIYIKLNKKFSYYFFTRARSKFNSWKDLGDYLGIKRGDTILCVNWMKKNSYFP